MKKRFAFLLLGIFSACTSPKVRDEISQQDRVTAIMNLAEKSSCRQYSWKNRGVLPVGYFKGLALSYSKSLCALKRGDTGAALMAAPVPATSRDALAYYSIANGTPEENLKNLYTLVMGLGARESSGKYCVGRDVTNPEPSSTGAEAGLFQTSYNAIEAVKIYSKSAAQEMTNLFAAYQADGSKCELSVFSEGVDYAKKCAGHNESNYGTPPGATYQKLAKACPMFHTEFSLIGIRHRRDHWGPINRHEVEFRQECKDLLTSIEQLGCGK